MNVFNYARTVNFCICRTKHFCEFLHYFVFAVNRSNTIRKTKPIPVATIIVLNRNSDKICKITFSCMHQIALIITECKTGFAYNYVGCSLSLDSSLNLIIPLLKAKRWNVCVYFDCISQSSSALCRVSGVSHVT